MTPEMQDGYIPEYESDNRAEHIPVPVESAKDIATRFRKSVVIILSYDPESQLTHTTTYGTTPECKEAAAHWGQKITEFVGCDTNLRTDYEDYRDPGVAALRAALWEACRDLVNAPHQEHMAARLNYEETAAYERIKKLVSGSSGI